jgi:hypothetical protein
VKPTPQLQLDSELHESEFTSAPAGRGDIRVSNPLVDRCSFGKEYVKLAWADGRAPAWHILITDLSLHGRIVSGICSGDGQSYISSVPKSRSGLCFVTQNGAYSYQ